MLCSERGQQITAVNNRGTLSKYEIREIAEWT